MSRSRPAAPRHRSGRILRRLGLGELAALLAVALLSLAGVRSHVMQAAAATAAASGAPMPECGRGAMARMDARRDPTGPAKTSCPWCAVAAHAPPLGFAPPLPSPTALAWAEWPPRPGLGPRGPPALDPRARGPPADLPAA